MDDIHTVIIDRLKFSSYPFCCKLLYTNDLILLAELGVPYICAGLASAKPLIYLKDEESLTKKDFVSGRDYEPIFFTGKT